MSDETRTLGEPHDRLTRITDAMVDAMRAHPETRKADRAAVFITDEQGGGLCVYGYDDDSGLDAVGDVLAHLRAIMRAAGHDLRVLPLDTIGLG